MDMHRLPCEPNAKRRRLELETHGQSSERPLEAGGPSSPERGSLTINMVIVSDQIVSFEATPSSGNFKPCSHGNDDVRFELYAPSMDDLVLVKNPRLAGFEEMV